MTTTSLFSLSLFYCYVAHGVKETAGPGTLCAGWSTIRVVTRCLKGGFVSHLNNIYVHVAHERKCKNVCGRIFWRLFFVHSYTYIIRISTLRYMTPVEISKSHVIYVPWFMSPVRSVADARGYGGWSLPLGLKYLMYFKTILIFDFLVKVKKSNTILI